MGTRLTIAACLLLAGTFALAADDAKKELAKLEGTWHAASMTADGKEAAAEVVKKATLTIKGGEYTYNTGKEEIHGKLVLDPSKTPKTVDAVRTDGKEKGSSLKGIYELSDDTFKVCFSAPGKERPTKLSAEAGSGNRLTVWKKAK